jgi:RND family efflux transporter MFP subunit
MKYLVSLVWLLSLTSVAAAPNGPPAASVVLESVTEMAVGEPATFNAFVRSRHDIALPATVDGEMLWVMPEGAVVKQGETIAKVDDRQLTLQRDEQQLLANRAAINVKYLEGEVERLSLLQQANLAAKTQLAEIVSRRDFARNDYLVANSRVAQFQETLDRTRIVAPVDVVVVQRLIEAGEFAHRGDSVVRVINPNELEIQVLVPVAYLNRLDRELPIEITVADISFRAPLRSVVQLSDQQSQTFGLLLDVPNEVSSQIVAGQFANATIAISDQRRSLFVPRDALVLRSEGSFVFRVNENNVARRVDVTVGNGQGSLVSVSGELAEGDRVAVRGLERLQDGQSVLPTS